MRPTGFITISDNTRLGWFAITLHSGSGKNTQNTLQQSQSIIAGPSIATDLANIKPKVETLDASFDGTIETMTAA
jgi:hypothetical protein